MRRIRAGFLGTIALAWVAAAVSPSASAIVLQYGYGATVGSCSGAAMCAQFAIEPGDVVQGIMQAEPTAPAFVEGRFGVFGNGPTVDATLGWDSELPVNNFNFDSPGDTFAPVINGLGQITGGVINATGVNQQQLGDIVWDLAFDLENSLFVFTLTEPGALGLLGASIGDSVAGAGAFGPPTVVPLPPAVWLLGSALAGLAYIRRRPRQAGSTVSA